MSNNNDNSFGSFMKILLGIGLAVLIFMSYMLAEQRGWVNTNFAERILQGVEDGKANREAEEQLAREKQKLETATQAKPQKSVAIPAPAQKKEAPKVVAPVPADNESEQSDDTTDENEAGGSEDDSASDEGSNESDGFGDEDTSSESTPQEAPEVVPAKPKKLDFTEIAGKKSTWPKTVRVRVKGTRVSLFDKYGNPIGKIEIPIGTRLFVRNVTSTGVLEVKSAKTGQIFKLHHSRTTFRKVYTGKPISDGLIASRSSGAPATADSASDSEESSDESDDFGSDDDSSDSDDDFFDDDF